MHFMLTGLSTWAVLKMMAYGAREAGMVRRDEAVQHPQIDRPADTSACIIRVVSVLFSGKRFRLCLML